MALVVAESAELAEDALAALRVEYEPLPAVAMADALRPDAPRVHPGGNVAARFTQRVGDPTSALARADLVLRERFTLHRGAGMAIETRGIVARWDADLGQITVWSTTQAPQILRRLLARYLKLPEHAVRVVTQDIGGGFGPKAIVYSEDILIPLLARALGRPVRFIETGAFTRRVVEVMSDDEYRKLQEALLARPTHGVLIPGTGGARKIRWGSQMRSKRGSFRVIYYWHAARQLFLKTHD